MEDRLMASFYLFDQNNSGGFFDINDEIGIGPRVWIEATDPVCAMSIAIGLGIYFDGISKGRDCSCCGDRWDRPCDRSHREKLDIDKEFDFYWHDTVYVHYLNGTIERIKKNG